MCNAIVMTKSVPVERTLHMFRAAMVISLDLDPWIPGSSGPARVPWAPESLGVRNKPYLNE